MLGQLGRRIDHCCLGQRVSIEVLDVGHVGPGAPERGRERVADLVGGERRPASSAGGGGERAVDAAAGPRPEGVGIEEGARGVAMASGTRGTAASRPPLPRGTAT